MKGKQYKHRNGNIYTVLFLTNTDCPLGRVKDYPIQVVYIGQNGKIWSRSLTDWNRSFTKINDEIQPNPKEQQMKEVNIDMFSEQHISNYFSFARYINGWYEYNSKTEKGAIYTDIVTGRLTTEQQIFAEWLKLRYNTKT